MLGLQGFDFGLERFVFGHLAFEEAAGEGGFFGEAGGGEQVGVLELVRAVLEVAELDEALVDEGVHAVVHLPVAGAEQGGELALGGVGPVVEDLQDPEVQVFELLCLGAGHGRRGAIGGL